MTDRVGVLAEATTTSVGTTTVGTVPTGKAWVFKPMFIMQANSGGATVLGITINGAKVMENSVTATQYAWSSSAALEKESATYPTGDAAADTVAPGPTQYYASAGDVISYTIGSNAAQSMNFQLVGTEIDV